MKKLITLPHCHTSREVEGLLQADPGIIDRLVRSGIHPPWVWQKRWCEPRWDSSTISDWLNILDTVDLDSLPENPPALERPVEAFQCRRRGATTAERLIAAKMCGVR